MGRFKCVECAAKCAVIINTGTATGDLIVPEQCLYKTSVSKIPAKWVQNEYDEDKCGYCGKDLDAWEQKQNEESEYTRPCCYPCFNKHEL